MPNLKQTVARVARPQLSNAPGAWARAVPAAPIEARVLNREPSLESDVFVPAGQALLTGILAGLSIAVVVALALELAPFWPTLAIAVTVCTAAAWLARLVASDRTLWRVERLTGVDVNRDGVVGRPSPVLVNPRQGQQAQDQAVEKQWRMHFASFIRYCAVNNQTTLRYWEPRIGRTQYAEYRGLLMGAGYAAWNNPHDQHAGWRLTLDPEEIVRQIFDSPALLASRGANP